MFAPHPVSGEVEVDVDWDDERDVEVRYRRADAETVQARVVMGSVGVWVRCVFCVGDAEGEGGEGWRIGEVGVLGEGQEGEWWEDLGEAERRFVESARGGVVGESRGTQDDGQDDEDDAAYWAQYDTTPAVTPGPEQTRRSNGARNAGEQYGGGNERSEEDAYYAQYAAVQPALDGHDPDEAEAIEGAGVESSLGREHGREYSTNAFGNGHAGNGNDFGGAGREMREAEIAQPRPDSSSSASGGSERSVAVERLEERAESMGSPGLEPSVERETQNEVAIRQHISTSMKSLYRLARAAGMEREDFGALVEREVALLGVEEDGA